MQLWSYTVNNDMVENLRNQFLYGVLMYMECVIRKIS